MLIVASLNISYSDLSGRGQGIGNFGIVRTSVAVVQEICVTDHLNTQKIWCATVSVLTDLIKK